MASVATHLAPATVDAAPDLQRLRPVSVVDINQLRRLPRHRFNVYPLDFSYTSGNFLCESEIDFDGVGSGGAGYRSRTRASALGSV